MHYLVKNQAFIISTISLWRPNGTGPPHRNCRFWYDWLFFVLRRIVASAALAPKLENRILEQAGTQIRMQRRLRLRTEKNGFSVIILWQTLFMADTFENAELKVRNYLKAGSADGSLSPLKHPQKRLSNPYEPSVSALVPGGVAGQRPVYFENYRSSLVDQS